MIRAKSELNVLTYNDQIYVVNGFLQCFNDIITYDHAGYVWPPYTGDSIDLTQVCEHLCECYTLHSTKTKAALMKGLSQLTADPIVPSFNTADLEWHLVGRSYSQLLKLDTMLKEAIKDMADSSTNAAPQTKSATADCTPTTQPDITVTKPMDGVVVVKCSASANITYSTDSFGNHVMVIIDSPEIPMAAGITHGTL